MQKRTIITLVGFIFTLFCIYLAKTIFFTNTKQETQSQGPLVLINETEIKVEIADNEALTAKGLSGRQELTDGNGMLFIFPGKKVSPIFWMKGMLIPIDIIWISEDKVVKIDEKVPPPESLSTPDSQLKKYPAPSLVDYVLEVASGFCERNGIRVGDSVKVVY